MGDTLIGLKRDPEHPRRVRAVTLEADDITDALDSLLRFRSPDAPVVSLYLAVPDDPGQLKAAKSKLHALVKPVKDLAESDDLSHEERESLRVDAHRMLELETLVLPTLQGRTLAFFRCSRFAFEESVVVPRRLRDRVFLDATPYVRPLLAVLDESHRYCVAVVDRERAWLYTYSLGGLEAEDKEQDRVLRKPNYAGHYGLEEYRVRNKAEELARRHFRETADALQRFVQDHECELVVVGGHREDVPELLAFLPQPLRRKVAGTFVIDTHTLTPAKVRDEAERIVEAYERQEEQQLVAQALERVATRGLGAVGLDWCLLATDEQAVQLLLIHDDVTAPGRACDNCGWLGLDGDPCPVCAHETRATADVIDEMAAAVIDAGGQVEHVYAETPLSEHVVAALLRFPVPLPLGATGRQGGDGVLVTPDPTP
jgi:peptide chain release factor subunit 1